MKILKNPRMCMFWVFLVVPSSLVAQAELLQNGSFQGIFAPWNLHQYESASVTKDAINPGYTYRIVDSGSERWHVQLSQRGINLEKDKNYELKFIAQAVTKNRAINVRVGRTVSPYDAYGEFGSVFLTTELKEFTYSFKMSQNSDADSRVEFNLGYASGDVYLKSASLICLDCSEAQDPIRSR